MFPDASDRRNLWAVALFSALFFALWTLAVFVVWTLGALPEPTRPQFRALFWAGAVLAWLWATKQARPLHWLGLAPLAPRAILWTAGAFLAVLGWNLLRVQIIGHAPGPPASAFNPVWSFVGVFAEELVFRGVIQTALVERLPAWWAITLAGLLFLATHVPGWLFLDLLPGPAAIVSVFLIGLVCGALRHYARSLWPTVGAHWANNLGAVL